MLTVFDSLRNIHFWSVVVRMLFALVCGGAIGLERSYKNRPAGFRTHILICAAATVASMTGVYLYLNAGLPTDISRIGAQVVSGLGFIGGGTIIVTKNQTIKGLTTAAGLWASGIIGLAIGAGYYEGAVAATILVLITEIFFSKLSKNIKHTPEFKLTLRYENKLALDQVLRYCKNRRLTITNLQVVAVNDEISSGYSAVISLRPRQTVDRQALETHIRSIPEVFAVDEI